MAVTVAEIELVARLKERDTDAFHMFVEAYQPRIRRWAGRMVTDAVDIEDITQEVLLASWRTAANLRDDTVLAPWLKTITDNACRMRARRMSRKPAIPIGLVPEPRHNHEPRDVAQAVAVEAALRKMPSREADILRLLYSQDKSLDEAAAILHVSPDAAKSLAARARRRFRRHFEPWFRGLGAFAMPVGRLFDFVERVPGDAVRAGVAAVVAATVVSVASPPVTKLPQASAETRPAERGADGGAVRAASPAEGRSGRPIARAAGPALLAAGPIGWMQSSGGASPGEIPQEWSDWAASLDSETSAAWQTKFSAWTPPPWPTAPPEWTQAQPGESPEPQPTPAPEPSSEPDPSPPPEDAPEPTEPTAPPAEPEPSTRPAWTWPTAKPAPSSEPAPSEEPAPTPAPPSDPSPSTGPSISSTAEPTPAPEAPRPWWSRF